MQALVYTPSMQGKGEFDGGKIKEQKPIGFPGEGSVVKRVGPLYYWAWGVSDTEARIGLHPHEGYEIISYVLEGFALHRDTLGTRSTVGTGGAQVMQTGSGISHQEELSANTELLQIWFEPEMAEAVKRPPSYRQHAHNDFPLVLDASGSRVKTVIGPGSPVQLVASAEMWDVEIDAGARYLHKVSVGYSLTALAIRGQGTWGTTEDAMQPVNFHHRDFILAHARESTTVEIVNTEDDLLRLILIQVPTTVSYPLYPKR